MRFRTIVMLLVAGLVAMPVGAAMSVVTPTNGEVVATLRTGQKAYLSMSAGARLKAMNDPVLRGRLFSVGATQPPVKLFWKDDSGVKSWDVTIASDDGEEQTMTVTNLSVAYVTNLELGHTYNWMVRGESGFIAAKFRTDTAAPRFLRAEGLSNFRDLGGWQTKSGERVRQKLILRSAGLRSSSKNRGGSLFGGKVELGETRVSNAGLCALKVEFGIKTDMELRTRQECAGMERSLIDGANWVHEPFVAYDFIDNLARGKEPFAKIFRVFANRDNYPILMHCSGGRDRTGTVAFILNGVLGVSEDDLLRDWQASIFSDTGAKFNASRIQRLLDYLHQLPGKDLNEQIEFYVKGCGVTDEEIKSFRQIMLEI